MRNLRIPLLVGAVLLVAGAAMASAPTPKVTETYDANLLGPEGQSLLDLDGKTVSQGCHSVSELDLDMLGEETSERPILVDATETHACDSGALDVNALVLGHEGNAPLDLDGKVVAKDGCVKVDTDLDTLSEDATSPLTQDTEVKACGPDALPGATSGPFGMLHGFVAHVQEMLAHILPW